MSTCSEGYTTRLKLPHWAERSDIYVHFHTTESLGQRFLNFLDSLPHCLNQCPITEEYVLQQHFLSLQIELFNIKLTHTVIMLQTTIISRKCKLPRWRCRHVGVELIT